MDQHKYQVGSAVRFVKASFGFAVGGVSADTFKVVRLLPDYLGANQYRLQSVRDGHERVVDETEIAAT